MAISKTINILTYLLIILLLNFCIISRRIYRECTCTVQALTMARLSPKNLLSKTVTGLGTLLTED